MAGASCPCTRPGDASAYPFPLTARSWTFARCFTPRDRPLPRPRLAGDARVPSNAASRKGLCDAASNLCESHGLDTVVLSGGVFQNELLLEDLKSLLQGERLQIWTNHAVPPNDGGISLGQAALAAFGQFGEPMHELSIAMSIVEMAEEESEKRGGLTVSAVHLKLGLLSGVVKEALLAS